MEYNPCKIEKRWQKIWEELGIFKAKDFSKKPKFYILDMFPYPSAEGLHVGHPRGYIATDVFAHFMRRKGFNLLHPMGWDAFGLPTENYAIKTGIHPEIITRRNIKRMKKQLQMIGLSYDWSREINTTDPEYYKWTQFIFLLLYKMGLAYKATLPINWCPSCKTGLANEEVIEGKCERCGTEVTKKDLRQWVLKITAYANRLLKDLDLLDWPEQIKEMQRNWIGKSEGWEIVFNLKSQISKIKNKIPVFTTRTDTLFGCTYLVLAPEHQIISKLKSQISNFKSVERYIKESKKKTERERISEVKEKTGIEIRGIKAINPVNGRAIPIFVADYVLIHYGTGAIMAVPAHDQRDFDFARKYNLPVIEVIKPYYEKKESKKEAPLIVSDGRFDRAYEKEGILINSDRFTGMKSREARERIGEWLTKKNLAKKAVYFKLRDWIFSRQRYWGEPVPIVHCQKCGVVPLRKKDLPLKLPRIKKYLPTGTGESPLAAIKKWVQTICPKCGGSAKRETNTMPQWAGSCWYFIAYLLHKNKEFSWNRKKINYWLPVDLYVGGAEHAVLHLLYARFWTKVLYDAGLIKFKEPFLKLKTLGLILAPDGQKMSKSRGNVILPDEIIEKYGADAFRLYEMFMGPFDEAINWNIKGIIGTRRFLEKAWRLQEKVERQGTSDKRQDVRLEKLIHQTIKKVTEDIENFKFNTAISQLMILVNNLQSRDYSPQHIKTLLLLLAPFAPHLTEEIWQKYFIESSEFKAKNSIHNQPWPKYDPKLVKEEMITLVIQVNGKVRDRAKVEAGISEKKAKKLALSCEKIKKWIKGKEIKKVIFVPGKLINIVV
ncbi:leucine--tRNA ligase [Patescibacteria group bacterium]|nr:leucine--tRNA ligase [Patescibacteria group bacterium]